MPLDLPRPPPITLLNILKTIAALILIIIIIAVIVLEKRRRRHQLHVHYHHHNNHCYCPEYGQTTASIAEEERYIGAGAETDAVAESDIERRPLLLPLPSSLHKASSYSQTYPTPSSRFGPSIPQTQKNYRPSVYLCCDFGDCEHITDPEGPKDPIEYCCSGDLTAKKQNKKIKHPSENSSAKKKGKARDEERFRGRTRRRSSDIGVIEENRASEEEEEELIYQL